MDFFNVLETITNIFQKRYNVSRLLYMAKNQLLFNTAWLDKKSVRYELIKMHAYLNASIQLLSY